MKKMTLIPQWCHSYVGRILAVILIFPLIFSAEPLGAQKIDKLEQVANGKAGSPLNEVDWVTGNVNEQKAHYAECMSIPYHLEIIDLEPGTTYCVTLGYDTKRNDKHAIDFLTSWESDIVDAHSGIFGHVHDPGVTPELIDPLANTTLAGMGLTEVRTALPDPNFPGAGSMMTNVDPNVHYFEEVSSQSENLISIWNGTFAGTPCIASEDDLTQVNAVAGIKVCFQVDDTPNADAVVLAWGGHIAASEVWGESSSATAITGSPYHMFVAACNDEVYNNGIGAECQTDEPAAITGMLSGCGNKEVQLQASAVVAPADCFILGANPVCGNTTTEYTASLAADVGTIQQVEWEIIEMGGDVANFTSTGNNNATDNTFPFTIEVTAVSGGEFELVATISYCPEGETCQGMGKLVETVCMRTITVEPEPTVTITASEQEACEDDDLITLSGSPIPTPEEDGDLGSFMLAEDSDPAPGALTDTGPGTATFDPQIAGPGTYIIVYQYTTPAGCTGEDEITIIVKPLPDVGIQGPSTICDNDDPVMFTGLLDGMPAGGGIFSISPPLPNGTFVISEVNGTATLTPAEGDAGNYQIQFSYDLDGCINTVQVPFTIYDSPEVEVTGPVQLCEEDPVATYTGSINGGSEAGGTFTISPATGGFTDNNDGTASLDPGAAGEGTYTITFTFIDQNNCEDSDDIVVTIDPTPQVGITLTGVPCEDETLIFTGMVNGADATGGTFSISPVPAGTFIDNGDGTADFTPADTDIGGFTVTFSFVDGNGCENEATLMLDLEKCCEFFATCNLNDAIQMVEYCDYNAFLAATPFLTNITDVFTMVTDNPCGTLVMTAADNVSGTLCPGGISVNRVYTLVDDLNGNMMPDVDEMFVTCEQNFLIQDKTAPVITCPAGDDLACDDPVPAPITTVTAFINAGGTVTEACSDPADMTISHSDELTGTVCGGRTLTRTYFITDECDNTSEACTQVFNIAAPELPVTDPPEFPQQLTCAEAFAYIAPPVPYDNNQGGECGIAGQIQPEVTNDFNKCTGGFIIIDYTETDICGRTFGMPQVQIPVLPAPGVSIGEPVLPAEPLSCTEAVAFSETDAGLVLYSNGETGPCLISGSLTPAIDKEFDLCGGIITIVYSGATECGTMLTTSSYELEVASAPAPAFTTDPPNMTVDCIDDIETSFLAFDNGETGFCEISGSVESTLQQVAYDGCVGEYIESWTYTDACDRTIEASRSIFIQRTVAVAAESNTVCIFEPTVAINFVVTGEPGIPDEYMIDAGPVAEAAGFTDIDWSPLPGSPLTLNLPEGVVDGGVYNFVFKVRDASCPSCVAEDPFQINVNSGEELTGCLVCNDQVNVTLNKNCRATITLDMVLEGDEDCERYELLKDALEVIVYDDYYEDNAGEPNNVISECGLFNYIVKLRDDFEGCIVWEKCWGSILAEDKTPPVVYCPPNINGIRKYTDDDGNTQFTPYPRNPAIYEAYPEDCDTFDDWFEDDDGIQPQTIVFNNLICDDIDEVVDVKASWNDPSYKYFTGVAKAIDACSGEIRTPVKVEDILREFECAYDDEAGYGRLAAVLLRTFYFEDEKGNRERCTQRIAFLRPYIHLPVCKVHVSACAFDGELTTDDLLDNDPYSVPFYVNGVCDTIYLTPDPSESGTYITKGHNCNYTISYTDQVFPGPDNCGNKIVRTWTILDWCWNPSLNEYPQLVGRPMDDDRDELYACYDFYDDWDDDIDILRRSIGRSDWTDKKYSWEQFIIYADEEAPEVTFLADDLDWDSGPDDDNTIRISTGPFNCTAVVDLEDRIEVKDNCSVKRWRFRLEGFQKDMKTGADVPVEYGWTDWTGHTLAGVPVGTYDLIVEAEDDCGNVDDALCTLIVEDQAEPVAVCDDELNVSIGGPGTTADGLARVRAIDVDEGSWDNCSDVELHVRRNIEDECVDIYLDQVEGFASLAELTPVGRADMGNQDLLDEYPNAMIFYFSAAPSVGGELVLLLEEDAFFYSIWRDAVYFTCCDISVDATDKVTIELRATDAEGNANVCWMNTLIEDKLPPSCEVHNKTILCTELDFDPADATQVAGRFGAPEEVIEIRDNCGATITEEVLWTPDNCGTGLIERVFTLTDASGRSSVCTQEVEVQEVNDYEIVFPGDDGSVECGIEPDRDISTQSFACDILAVNKDTTRYQALGEECFNLLITYRVINWCEYDGVSTEPIEVPRDWDGDDDLTEDHVIRVQPDGDLLPDVAGQQVVTWTQADGDLESLTANEYAKLTPGFWEYSQLLKIYDNTAPEIEVESLEFCAYGTPPDDCGGNVNIVFTVTDACTPNDTEVRSLQLDPFNSGNPQDLADALGYTLTKIDDNTYQITGKLPVGDHTFMVSAADGCGNLDRARIAFSVVDCKSPAPICIQTLSVDLMPVDADGDGTVDGGMNTVWASSFIAAPIDDCSPFDIPENVKYFVFNDKDLENGAESITLDSLNAEHASVAFTCDDEGTELIYVVALDAAGNFDYCTVMAVVQPGVEPSPCGENGGGGTISGLITDERLNAVAGVNVQLSGQASMNYLTDDNGDYAFSGLTEGYDYSVTPGKENGHLNGVSTFDLVLISKHILGIKPLDSPYKMIAADVNNSTSITTLDLIQLRKLILSIDTEFGNNTSWRFVDAGYNFPDPAKPWTEQFPEVKNINNLQDGLTGDFVAVKIGDVNGSAVVNALQSADERSNAGTFELKTADVSLEAGEEYTIDFTATDLAGIEGYQFTLTFDRDAVELVDILYGEVREENFGVFASEGMITTSWNAGGNSDFRLPTSDLPLFSLVLRSRANGQLSDALSISSRLTQAEAYATTGETMDVTLNFGAGAVDRASFELYQNRPNPFRSETIIGFHLPEAAAASIKVNDVTGRLLKIIEGEFVEGYNQIELYSSDLDANGVLWYTVETGEYTATRKMIVLE